MLDRRALIMGTSSAAVLASLPARAAPTARHGFNDEEIDWHLFDDGMARARETGTPILFLAHATWCPHCRRTKPIYRDELVVRRVRHFVPILVDRDEQADITARYAPDGDYVPRHMALMPDGTHMEEVTGPYEKYRYLVPYDRPDWLRAFLWHAWKGFNDRKAAG